MRRILVDHARSRQAAKRGYGHRVALDEGHAVTGQRSVDLLALDQALEKLAAFDPRQSQLVELRFFGGLSIEETAEALSVSKATVKREWSLARAWLFGQLGEGPDLDSPGLDSADLDSADLDSAALDSASS